MASDVLFPFFEILVNSIFGSVGVSLVALAVTIAVILGYCKSSWVFTLYWLVFYTMVVLTFYVGGIGMVLAGILSITYLAIQIIKYVSPG